MFALALEFDERCATAHAGLGALAAIRGDGESAFTRLSQAERLDQNSLVSFARACAENAEIRALFARCHIAFADGKLERTE
jgi:hypothetical protein